ncbi:MAG: hypothetical protein OXF55_15045 [Caldilineaceae bacterium]|nr:hypothetical protein [Caldilineaceae bacterium]
MRVASRSRVRPAPSAPCRSWQPTTGYRPLATDNCPLPASTPRRTIPTPNAGCTLNPPLPETENEQRAPAPARAVTPRDDTGAIIVLPNDLCQVDHFSEKALISALNEPVKELKSKPKRTVSYAARVEAGDLHPARGDWNTA